MPPRIFATSANYHTKQLLAWEWQRIRSHETETSYGSFRVLSLDILSIGFAEKHVARRGPFFSHFDGARGFLATLGLFAAGLALDTDFL
jgi:hypothetical protein